MPIAENIDIGDWVVLKTIPRDPWLTAPAKVIRLVRRIRGQSSAFVVAPYLAGDSRYNPEVGVEVLTSVLKVHTKRKCWK